MTDEPLSVARAAQRAGVSTDTIRRAYRSGALPAYRPGGQQRVVIRAEDLDAWAFADEHLVAPAAPALRAVDAEDAPMVRPPARRRSHRDSSPGSVERLLEIERRS